MKPFYYINNATIGEFTGEKFDSLERATEESLELAEANPGQSFEILRCVGISSTSKASTFWMDGEEPPEKPRYRTLEDGELIAEGDEFSHPEEGWKRHTIGIGDVMSNGAYLPTRRPL